MALELFLITLGMCVLGAFTNVLLWIKSWREITSFEATKTLLLGLIVGILWFFMRVEHNVPDSVISFVVGYCAKDILDAIVEKFKPEL
jgi:hypothetical protein